jgi:hypothetical protein
MDEDQLQELRRVNLRDWVSAGGGPAAICRKRGLSKSYPSYISQTISGGSFAARGARNAETQLGMPPNWLDQDHSKSSQSQAPVSSTSGLDLQQAIGVMAQALQTVSVARRPELVKVFELLADHPGEPDYLARLAKLLGQAVPSALPEKRQSNGR